MRGSNKMAASARGILVGMAALVLGTQVNAKAEAVEIKALSTIGVQSAIEALVPKFEKASGHKVTMVFGLSAPLAKRVADGEVVDVYIGNREGVDGLIKSAKITTGSDASFASAGMGVAVRAGAPKPDISTPDALKRTLLAARSVGYGNPAAGGAGGIYFAKVLERLEIVEQIKAKAKHPTPGTFIATMLVNGEVELGVQQIPELMSVSGIDIVGPFPGDLQATTIFAAGVPASAKEPAAARALIAFLRSPEAVAVIRAKGLDPR